MGSQFVDFNADGHIDYVSATFDGSPHVSYGSEKGFTKPVRLVDAKGERLLISYYWDYEKKSHLKVGRSMPDGKAVGERCISALAFDWDADGDYDLLLGGYEEGKLYLQMNEGSNKDPKFTGKNIPVMAGEKEFALSSKMTTPRLVDWDGDGDMDLIAGSFGESYSPNGKGGGVYLSMNEGKKGKPSFGPLRTLIEPSKKGAHDATRPDAGLYADAVDYDGDGDLDLVVGGYSMWSPKPRELSEEEQKEVVELEAAKAKLSKEKDALNKKAADAATKATVGMKPGTDAHREKTMAVYAEYRPAMAEMSKKLRPITKRLDELKGAPQRKSFVWLYERLSSTKVSVR